MEVEKWYDLEIVLSIIGCFLVLRSFPAQHVLTTDQRWSQHQINLYEMNVEGTGQRGT